MKASLFAGIFLALASAEKPKSKVDHKLVPLQKFPEADLDALYRSSGRFKDAKKA